MTQEAFIKELDKGKYSYEIQGDKIVITHSGRVLLDNLRTLPPGVEFKNNGNVDLDDLKTLPPGVVFKNGGDVGLNFLKSLPPGVVFKNGGDVGLYSLKSLPPGVEFQNGGDVYINELGWVEENEVIKIGGVANKRLLNLMIKKELFI